MPAFLILLFAKSQIFFNKSIYFTIHNSINITNYLCLVVSSCWRYSTVNLIKFTQNRFPLGMDFKHRYFRHCFCFFDTRFSNIRCCDNYDYNGTLCVALWNNCCCRICIFPKKIKISSISYKNKCRLLRHLFFIIKNHDLD